MVEAAAPFIAVEQAIDSLLPPEQKTELWTLAWSLLGPQRQAQQVEWITDEAAAYPQASYANIQTSDHRPQSRLVRFWAAACLSARDDE
jgi:hypothetical protein